MIRSVLLEASTLATHSHVRYGPEYLCMIPDYFNHSSMTSPGDAAMSELPPASQ